MGGGKTLLMRAKAKELSNEIDKKAKLLFQESNGKVFEYLKYILN